MADGCTETLWTQNDAIVYCYGRRLAVSTIRQYTCCYYNNYYRCVDCAVI